MIGFTPKLIDTEYSRREGEKISSVLWNALFKLLIEQGNYTSTSLNTLYGAVSSTAEVQQMIDTQILEIGAGDMAKATYDNDRDGVIDIAATVSDGAITNSKIANSSVAEKNLSTGLINKIDWIVESITALYIGGASGEEITGTTDLLNFGWLVSTNTGSNLIGFDKQVSVLGAETIGSTSVKVMSAVPSTATTEELAIITPGVDNTIQYNKVASAVDKAGFAAGTEQSLTAIISSTFDYPAVQPVCVRKNCYFFATRRTDALYPFYIQTNDDGEIIWSYQGNFGNAIASNALRIEVDGNGTTIYVTGRTKLIKAEWGTDNTTGYTVLINNDSNNGAIVPLGTNAGYTAISEYSDNVTVSTYTSAGVLIGTMTFTDASITSPIFRATADYLVATVYDNGVYKLVKILNNGTISVLDTFETLSIANVSVCSSGVYNSFTETFYGVNPAGVFKKIIAGDYDNTVEIITQFFSSDRFITKNIVQRQEGLCWYDDVEDTLTLFSAKPANTTGWFTHDITNIYVGVNMWTTSNENYQITFFGKGFTWTPVVLTLADALTAALSAGSVISKVSNLVVPAKTTQAFYYIVDTNGVTFEEISLILEYTAANAAITPTAFLSVAEDEDYGAMTLNAGSTTTKKYWTLTPPSATDIYIIKLVIANTGDTDVAFKQLLGGVDNAV